MDFPTYDLCLQICYKYSSWAYEEVPSVEEHGDNEDPNADPHGHVPEEVAPLVVVALEDGFAKYQRKLRERTAKQIEMGDHAAGLRISVIVTPREEELEVVRAFGQYGAIDYYNHHTVGDRGILQVYIKYFQAEHAEAALRDAPARYGARPAMPRTISQNEKDRLKIYHPLCRRMLIRKFIFEHQKICDFQAGAEWIRHKNCGFRMRKRAFADHLKLCTCPTPRR